MLGRVHAGPERRRPGRGVHRRAPVLVALQRLPVHQEGDGVLGLRDAVVWLAGRDTGACARDDTGRHGPVLHDPAVDVDVVRREVVAARVLSAASS